MFPEHETDGSTLVLAGWDRLLIETAEAAAGGKVAEVAVLGIDTVLSTLLLVLPALAAIELAEIDVNTLSAELVAVNEPVVMTGVEAASDMVGVVDLPIALLRMVLTELVSTAGVTLESEEDGPGCVPEPAGIP